jgi:hypothetical protein
MVDKVPIYPIDKTQTNLLLLPRFPLLQPPRCSSLDLMTKDGALGLPVELGQLTDVIALTRSLLGESFNGFFASLPEN